jgi:5-methylcytosine-specific restriction endonuclease McrA
MNICIHCNEKEGIISYKRFCSTSCYDKWRYHNNPKRKEKVLNRLKEERKSGRESARQKEYYKRNKEEILAYNKEWRTNNKEKVLKINNAYKKAHPLQTAMSNRALYSNQKARRLGIEGKLTQNELIELFERLKWKCAYCNKQLDFKSVTVDHKTPFSRGGLNIIANVAPCCESCNKSKATKTAEEFLGLFYFEE